MVMFAGKTVLYHDILLCQLCFEKNRKNKHYRAFYFGQVQTATEHFYIFIDRIQRWMNIFLAFFLRLLHRRLWQFNQALQGPISAP